MAKRQSRFSAALAGLVGGAAGVFVMNQVMKRTKELLPDETKLDLAEGEDPLWSLVFVPRVHMHTLLGHLAYGAVTAAGTRLASKVLT